MFVYALRMQEDEMKKIMEDRRREKEEEKRARLPYCFYDKVMNNRETFFTSA